MLFFLDHSNATWTKIKGTRPRFDEAGWNGILNGQQHNTIIIIWWSCTLAYVLTTWVLFVIIQHQKPIIAYTADSIAVDQHNPRSDCIIPCLATYNFQTPQNGTFIFPIFKTANLDCEDIKQPSHKHAFESYLWMTLWKQTQQQQQQHTSKHHGLYQIMSSPIAEASGCHVVSSSSWRISPLWMASSWLRLLNPSSRPHLGPRSCHAPQDWPGWRQSGPFWGLWFGWSGTVWRYRSRPVALESRGEATTSSPPARHTCPGATCVESSSGACTSPIYAASVSIICGTKGRAAIFVVLFAAVVELCWLIDWLVNSLIDWFINGFTYMKPHDKWTR